MEDADIFDEQSEEFNEEEDIFLLKAYTGQLAKDPEYIPLNQPHEKKKKNEEETSTKNDRKEEVICIDDEENSSRNEQEVFIIESDDTPTKKRKRSDEPIERKRLTTSGSFRYWSDALYSLICNNCSKPGHIAHNCPEATKVEPCYICGSCDHQSYRCPNELCFRCNMPGHQIRSCMYQKAPLKCYVCGSDHDPQNCDSVFDGEKRSAVIQTCYNCGQNGHAGKNCKEMNMEQLNSMSRERDGHDKVLRTLRKQLWRFRRHSSGSQKRTKSIKRNVSGLKKPKKKKKRVVSS